MSPLALELHDVTVELGGRAVVRNASVAFAAGRTTAVVGRSGAGKSVLLKAAAGLLPRAHGTVTVHRPPLAFVHQDPALLDDLDVEENVAFAVARAHPQEAAARTAHALALLDLTGLRRAFPARLPVAVQKRTALARALALAPGVLIVDEPTTGLDPVAAALVDASLARVAAGGDTTLIVITHSPRTLAALSPTLVLVRDGTIIAAPESAQPEAHA
jgi:ABC-type transporter Mla maintaining outer membrane lipid asymmetry ATPase subunit MlaF